MSERSSDGGAASAVDRSEAKRIFMDLHLVAAGADACQQG